MYRWVGILAVSLVIFGRTQQGCAALVPSKIPLVRGYARIPYFVADEPGEHLIAPAQRQGAIKDLCFKLRGQFKRFSWREAPCGAVPWHAQLRSSTGNPLIYAVFGAGKHTTLILGGVHPDEITPIHLSFEFARYLHKNPAIYQGKGLQIIVAPLVNPDGFLKAKPSRVNSRGIDINRNFFTTDWYEDALMAWSNKNKRARYFPGTFPNSESEVVFQVELIAAFAPSKILSIHAPLGFYDYDGPGDQVLAKPRSQNAKRAKRLLREMAKKSRNYRIVDYSVFPGSLGKMAGNERKIPTLTLELETTDPRKVHSYWEKFLPAFLESVTFRMQSN